MQRTFKQLGLSEPLCAACAEMGLRRPTPIQAACIGPALDGRDVLGSAETGSGKTAAFALPVLQALSREPYGVFAVVLSPARELAQQIADQFSALGARLPTRVCVVVGGADMMRQALALAERAKLDRGVHRRKIRREHTVECVCDVQLHNRRVEDILVPVDRLRPLLDPQFIVERRVAGEEDEVARPKRCDDRLEVRCTRRGGRMRHTDRGSGDARLHGDGGADLVEASVGEG